MAKKTPSPSASPKAPIPSKLAHRKLSEAMRIRGHMKTSKGRR